MARFVLVHGAFHGAWCWARVVDRLRGAGHDVDAPVLSGLGERRHLAGPHIDLDVHIGDVVSAARGMRDVVLVGHSYAGFVIAGACERLAGVVARLVFLDALVPAAGECVLDAMPHEIAARRRAAIVDDGGLRAFPVPDVADYGIEDPDDAAWLRANLAAHPAATYETKLRLTRPLGEGARLVYIACRKAHFASVVPSWRRVRGDPRWQVLELATGHEPMVTAPAALPALLAVAA